MAGLVAQNFGIAVMPEVPVLSQLDVTALPIADQHLQRFIYMAERKNSYQPPLVQRFADYVRHRPWQ